MADALSRQVQLNHLAIMSSYGTELHDRILQVSQQDVRYMEFCTCCSGVQVQVHVMVQL